MTEHVVAIIQARMGSTRLPGKVMYPLDGKPVLEQVVTRTSYSKGISNVVVATSTKEPDDVIKHYAPSYGAKVVRGSESNVLQRFELAIERFNPEIIVRITADCPLISPEFIDASIAHIQDGHVDYVSAGLNRTFPRGLTCESFTADSFDRVRTQSTETHHREHVTPYYREHPEEFKLYNLESREIFNEPWLQNRTDLRLTLDEPADYHLLEKVYREVEYDEMIDIGEVIWHIDDNGLAENNDHVEQKTV